MPGPGGTWQYRDWSKHRRGTDNPAHVLTEDQVRDIRRQHAEGSTQAALAETYQMSKAAIGKIVRRETWADLPD